MKTNSTKFVSVSFLLIISCFFSQPVSADEEFSGFDIRVIRPRYFVKQYKLEIGTQAIMVTNQSFIYSYLASLAISFHFSEYFSLEVDTAVGSTIDKSDKKILQNSFDIKTQIFRANSMNSLLALYSPSYGKYQLSTGRLIYFDTFVLAGGGTTGVDYKYDNCSTKKGAVVPKEKIVNYPTVVVGVGQRFFLNKFSSIRWDFRSNIFTADSKDGSCALKETNSESLLEQNFTLQLGYSVFI